LATTPSQRSYQALCPNCGAAVEFRSATSGLAVCGFCQSTIARDGPTLRNIGKMAELFEDYSPLQIGTTGVYSGTTFTLIGRLQYRWAEGTWNEWHAWFDNGTSAWLSDDNGRYVLAFDAPEVAGLPAAAQLTLGAPYRINNAVYSVASITEVQLVAAQGELPFSQARLPKVGVPFTVADLRNDRGEVLTLDYYDAEHPTLSIGRSATLAELKLQRLRETTADKDYKARAFNCPNCGASVEAKLDGTQSLTCGSCASVIDISQGLGADIKAYKQATRVKPLLPLGATGKLDGEDWQIVGFQQRKGVDGDGETFTWQEYLLFNRMAGFKFLVDTSEGWSLVVPETGAPKFTDPGRGGATAKLGDRTYREVYRYVAETVYVEGEFYWQVKQGQRTRNIDFEAGPYLLAREQADKEVTWSGGQRIDARKVFEAFGVQPDAAALSTFQAKPVSGAKSLFWFIFFVVLLIVLFGMLARCSDDGSTSYSGSGSGGSYGGFRSGGGGHK
jgi:ribosomal protein S27AE